MKWHVVEGGDGKDNPSVAYTGQREGQALLCIAYR